MTPAKRAILLRQIFKGMNERAAGDDIVCKAESAKIMWIDNTESYDLIMGLEFDMPDGKKVLLPCDLEDIRKWKRQMTEFKNAWIFERSGETRVVQLIKGGASARRP